MRLRIILVSSLLFCTTPCLANNQTETFLKLVLDNMSELHQHHIGIEVGSYALYTNPTGGEAVYNKETGKLVVDPTNMGTHNYFVYSKGAEHFSIDTYPWLVMGNKGEKWAALNVPTQGEDRSSAADRATAWQLDFVDAVNKVCETMPEALDKPQKGLFQENDYQRFTKLVFQPLLEDKGLAQALRAGHDRFCHPRSADEARLMGFALLSTLEPKNLNRPEFQEAYKRLVVKYKRERAAQK